MCYYAQIAKGYGLFRLTQKNLVINGTRLIRLVGREMSLCSLQKRGNPRLVPLPFREGSCRQAAALEFLPATARARIVPRGAFAGMRQSLRQSESPYTRAKPTATPVLRRRHPAVIHSYESILQCRCHGLGVAQRTGSHARALGTAQGSSAFYIARQRGRDSSILRRVLCDPLWLAESCQDSASHPAAHPVAFQCDQGNPHPQRVIGCGSAVERNRVEGYIEPVIEHHVALMSPDVGNEFDTAAFDAMTAQHGEDASMCLFFMHRAIFEEKLGFGQRVQNPGPESEGLLANLAVPVKRTQPYSAIRIRLPATLRQRSISDV